MPTPNMMQRILRETYENGEFSHIESDQEVERCGDSLFLLMWKGFEDATGESAHELALHRIEVILDQVANVRQSISEQAWGSQ